ncbi:MAG: Gfo/Idh/MocA family oxidoreductase [Sphingobacteriales bacterium]|nr:Gfo/Idh/MocA family oxidoreductase [Sphingobacteriales bacterium]
MNPLINTCIVGFGISGKIFHTPFLLTNPGYRWTSVVERNTNNALLVKKDIITYRSFDEAINDTKIDLIIITTPNETHFPYTRKALEAGKHVVVEKPFTITSQEALQLIEIAKTSGKILSVYQNRRYVSDYLTIKEILGDNLLGEIVEFEAHYNRYRPEAKPNAWREEEKPGSGILYDLGAHLIDQALCLFALPNFISADIRCQRPHAKTDDYFDLRLDYDFTKVILKAGMLVREPGPRYMIHGTKGSFSKYGEDPQEAALRKGLMPAGEEWGKESPDIYGLIHTEKNGEIIKQKVESKPGNYGHYYSNLYNTIVNKAPLMEKPEHGFNTIRLIELAIESNKRRATIPCTDLIKTTY